LRYHSQAAEKTPTCDQSEQREDVKVEHRGWPVPKTGNLHRIGPANDELAGNRERKLAGTAPDWKLR
jgi:hypothetical protein